MKCLVSGATGFIGRELCRQLDASAMSYIGLSRKGGVLPNGRASVVIDLGDQSVQQSLLDDIDVVFHLAGIAHQAAQPAMYEAVNHQATVELARAAVMAGVKTFIFLSSVKAMGAPANPGVRTEGDCTVPRDAYGRSKLQAELDLQAAYANSEMSVIILRPALVYGVGAAGNLDLLARAVRLGMPGPPLLGGRSMIALEDIVGLLMILAHSAPKGVHTWIVCEDHCYTAGEISDLMRVALGKKPVPRWLPLTFWRLGCAVRDRMAGAEKGSTFGKIFGTELYCADALRLAVDWRPQVAFADSVRRIMVAQ
ncbi:MAG: NAD-dependent epimerase/dehydratase family protein [Halioglobus sp.]